MLLFRREDTSHKMISGERSDQQLSRYGSLAMFREVFFVNKFHRKPENLGAESCGCMIPVQREVVAVRGANSSTVTCTVRITIK